MIDTRETINVENYPEIDPSTEEGREELSLMAAHLAYGRTPVHFVFRQNGKEIGEIIVQSPLTDYQQ